MRCVLVPDQTVYTCSWHSTAPTPTRKTVLYVWHTLFPREDPRDDVRVGVGVMEFQLIG